MKIPVPQPSTPSPNKYHHGRTVKRVRKVDYEKKHFIAWDGEGVNLQGDGLPQSYVLFGSSKGHVSSTTGLSTFDCLDHIIETGQKYPGAIHVGFAFGYDSNMIVRSLSPTTLARLHKQGWARIKRDTGETYVVTYAKGKFFRVTKYKENYDRKHNPTAKTTVQIFDIFSFFMCSFIKAYKDMVGAVPDIITTGKAARSTFSIEEFDKILKYWTVEIQMLRELAEELRRRCYNAGLRITQWHGPGALASYAMGQNTIKSHMADTGETVRECARYGYAGGRFELFKIGRVTGPIYSIDINSAYPHAIAQLPSLADGDWVHVVSPEHISKFGIYRISLKQYGGLEERCSPLFHRDKDHNITFPWTTEGWYWSPEAHSAKRVGATIVEGWVFRERGKKERPFDYINGMYAKRKDWQLRGISAQIALKLCMNATYGKLAQRVGWDETKQRIPPWHQLEWAGWVTSYVRGRLFEVMRQIPLNQLVAVETDGIYTTFDPAQLGITNSKELGQWEVKRFDELMYVQSGLAWLRKGDEWECKRRGLDPCRAGHDPEDCHCPGTFSLNACRNYLRSLTPEPDRFTPWEPYVGETTRFLGLGQSLMSSQPLSRRHCVWETVPREISPGQAGKRIHVAKLCRACQSGHTAYDAAHDLVINSRAVLDPGSFPHTIPWEPEVGHAQWRDHAELELDDVTLPYV